MTERALSPAERDLRARLGVPDDAETVLMLGMDAHLDWDWLNTFTDLLITGNGGDQASVQKIMTHAWYLMIANRGTPPYRYAVCEMGFLRAALATVPSLYPDFLKYGLATQLGLEGGGITSPDNLLPHGEAFIRNYLLGWAWQASSTGLGLTSTFAYVPDDFGHDAQLPAVLAAMGLTGVSFSRCPGSWASSSSQPLSGGESLYSQLMASGADFYWQAADGSSVLTHLEQKSYSQANSLKDDCGDMGAAVAELQQVLAYNQASSPAGYVYAPCGNDFALPIPCLLDIAAAWNKQQYPVDNVYAVVAGLPDYMAAVAAAVEGGVDLQSRVMDPTPYWTGYYASRPILKILHQATTRALLGAEVYAAVARALQSADRQPWLPVEAGVDRTIAAGWEALVPSTHHDYITGTAVDAVYSEEQIPLLRAARATADGARQTAIESIAPMIAATPGPGETPIAVLNQLGFTRTGLVEVPAPPAVQVQSVRMADGGFAPVQTTAAGTLLFAGSAPGLGYQSAYLSSTAPTVQGPVTASSSGGFYTLTSDQLTVTIDASQGFGISALSAMSGDQPSPSIIPTGQAANQLVFYQDQGNLYNFGNEFGSAYLTETTGSLSVHDHVLAESGPLRARVVGQLSWTDDAGQSADYQIEYSVAAGEPYVRIAVTGSAPLPADPLSPSGQPLPYAVMARFPLSDGSGDPIAVTGVTRGTPYHWFDQLPVPYWQPPTFQATHHFVLASGGSGWLAGFHHADVPAWAIDSGGAMIACILRNTPATYPWPSAPVGRGANGCDLGAHTRRYAIRVPQGVAATPDVALFQESFGFATPLAGAAINVPYTGVEYGHPVDDSFPDPFSLASVTSGNAIITVAKAGQFDPAAVVLRIYQPSNTTQTVTVTVADQLGVTTATPITALEQPIAGAASIPIAGGQFSLTMERSLATVALNAGGGAPPTGQRG